MVYNLVYKQYPFNLFQMNSNNIMYVVITIIVDKFIYSGLGVNQIVTLQPTGHLWSPLQASQYPNSIIVSCLVTISLLFFLQHLLDLKLTTNTRLQTR